MVILTHEGFAMMDLPTWWSQRVGMLLWRTWPRGFQALGYFLGGSGGSGTFGWKKHCILELNGRRKQCWEILRQWSPHLWSLRRGVWMTSNNSIRAAHVILWIKNLWFSVRWLLRDQPCYGKFEDMFQQGQCQTAEVQRRPKWCKWNWQQNLDITMEQSPRWYWLCRSKGIMDSSRGLSLCKSRTTAGQGAALVVLEIPGYARTMDWPPWHVWSGADPRLRHKMCVLWMAEQRGCLAKSFGIQRIMSEQRLSD